MFSNMFFVVFINHFNVYYAVLKLPELGSALLFFHNRYLFLF